MTTCAVGTIGFSTKFVSSVEGSGTSPYADSADGGSLWHICIMESHAPGHSTLLQNKNKNSSPTTLSPMSRIPRVGVAIALASTRYSVGRSCGPCQSTLYRPTIALEHSVSASSTVNEFIRAYNFPPRTSCAPTAMRIDTPVDTPERSMKARIMAGRRTCLAFFPGLT